MPRLSDQLASGKTVLWIEATAYAERLLANGAVPWRDAAEVVAWHRKAQGLLKSNVATVDFGVLAEAWRKGDPVLTEEMAAKKRMVAPLRALLASDGLRAHIGEILHGLRACHGDLPLAVVLPSPRHWVALAYAAVHGQAPDVGEDEADSAAMYVADFLRAFGEIGIDAVLLQEDAASAPADAAEVKWYQSVFNVAAHYRWECGLQLPVARDIAGAEGVGFCIAPAVVAGLPTGVIVPASFWQDASAPAAPQGGFLYVDIPADAVPETVLARLAALRTS